MALPLLALAKGFTKGGFLKTLGKEALKQSVGKTSKNEITSSSVTRVTEPNSILPKRNNDKRNTEKYNTVSNRKKFGPYNDIETLLREDRRNKDIKSRIGNMLFTTSQYIGGYSAKDLRDAKNKAAGKPHELSKKELKKLADSVNRLKDKVVVHNQPTAVTEETGRRIVDSNQKIIALLSQISADLIDEQKTDIDQSFRNKKPIQQVQTVQQIQQGQNTSNNGGLLDLIGDLVLASMAMKGAGSIAGAALNWLGKKAFDKVKNIFGPDKEVKKKSLFDRIFKSDDSENPNETKASKENVEREKKETKETKASKENVEKEKIQKSSEVDHKKSKFGKLGKLGKLAKFGGPALAALGFGLEAFDIESEAAGAKTQEDKDKIRGKGYTKMAGVGAAMTAGAIAGQALIPIPGVGALIGGVAGLLGGEELMNSEIGKKAQDLGVSAFKYTSDNDIMEDLDSKGIIDYNRIGSSEILDKQALMKLDKEDIKKLIDFNDFDGKDLEYLKYVYDVKLGKVEAITTKKIDEFYSKLNEHNEKIDDIMQMLYSKNQNVDTLYAWNKLKGMKAEDILKSKELEIIEKEDPRVANIIRTNARSDIRLRTLAKDKLGMTEEDLDRKYKTGKFSQAYMKSKKVDALDIIKHVPVLSPLAQVYDIVKPEQVSLDHLAEYDNEDNKLLDTITKSYETDIPESQRFAGDVKLVGGQALNATGSKCQGPFVKPSAPRGIRNNNPGNIRISNAAWLGKIPMQYNTDGSFEQFTYAEFGIRALAMNLKNYQAKHHLYTVRGMINRFAPSNENNTNSYVNIVSKSLGVSPDTPIDFADPNVSLNLVKAIIKHENGVNPYPDDIITRGINSALGLQNLEVNEAQGVTKYDNTEAIAPEPVQVEQRPVDMQNADNVDKFIDKKSTADTSRLNPEFKARLAEASKTYYEETGDKIRVNTAYRDSHKQAELYLRKALGDPELKYDCALPANDEAFTIGSSVGRFKVDPSKIRFNRNISVQGNQVIVHGSGRVNAHGRGLAVDIDSVQASKFENISKQFGLFRPISTDPVHFQMFKGSQVVGDVKPEVVEEPQVPVENVKTPSPAITAPTIQQPTQTTNESSVFINQGTEVPDKTKESVLALAIPPSAEELLRK